MAKEQFEGFLLNYLKLKFSTRFWDPWESFQEEAKRVMGLVCDELSEFNLLETPFTAGNLIKPEAAARLIKVRWDSEKDNVEFSIHSLLRVLFSYPPIHLSSRQPELMECSECGKRASIEPVFPGSPVLLPPDGWTLGPVQSQCPDC